MFSFRKIHFKKLKQLIMSRSFTNNRLKTYRIPERIQKPHYFYESSQLGDLSGEIDVKNEDEIKTMRESCRIAARILKKCKEIVEIGVTTDEIDSFVFDEIIKHDSYPSPLYYRGFPKALSTSVNSVACHGIPNTQTKLLSGDIVNIDITIFHDGFHGDCSRTFLVGEVDAKGQYLVKHNEKALYEAIQVCAPGVGFQEIGRTISEYARKVNLTVIRDFIGHGIGRTFHCAPEIYHFENNINTQLMQPGMTFTIEPIFSEGSNELELWEDGWTANTIDGSRTAQCEHTILITENGVEVLTQ